MSAKTRQGGPDKDTKRKRITNLSDVSLLGLTAELKRKEEEAKALRSKSANCIQGLGRKRKAARDGLLSSAKQSRDREAGGNKGVEERDLKDREGNNTAFTSTVSDKEKESNVAASLEKKAVMYDRLRKKAWKNAPDSYLVDFALKDSDEEEEGLPHNEDGEWKGLKTHIRGDDNDNLYTDYTDAFGRTRRVLKAKIEELKKLDRDALSSSGSSEEDSSSGSLDDEAKEEQRKRPRNEFCYDYSGDGKGKGRWEGQYGEDSGSDQQERVVHFQNVLGSEVIDLGTAYFKFSSDEGKRLEEKEELIESHNQTNYLRDEAARKKEERDSAIQERLKKVQLRKQRVQQHGNKQK
eukprot:Nk52_evm44s1129 gene=Nk52_evmTU44s1129